jgi:threonine dehydrogenase-like Zn-dependent dehydrogenase
MGRHGDPRPGGAHGEGWHSWKRALTIMALGTVKLAPTITRRIPLEDWEDAFARLEAKREIKVMIYPNAKHMPRG